MAANAPTDAVAAANDDHEKHPVSDAKPDPLDLDFTDAQAGVQRVEATAMVWSKAQLIAAYCIIWFIYVVISLQEVVLRTYSPFVTSTFARHSLTAMTSIISSIVAGLSKLPLAKILDTWGRPQGLGLTLFVWVVGIIMMAACDGVKTYAAAQVFSTVGYDPLSPDETP